MQFVFFRSLRREETLTEPLVFFAFSSVSFPTFLASLPALIMNYISDKIPGHYELRLGDDNDRFKPSKFRAKKKEDRNCTTC